MFCKIKERLDRIEIVHLDKVNPSGQEVLRALYSEDNDAVSYYITTDISRQQIIDFEISYAKYKMEYERYLASKYERGCGGMSNEPTNEYIKHNPPGMIMYDIITEIPPNAILHREGEELSKELFQNIEYIPNFLLGAGKIEIKNSEKEYIKVYTMKMEDINQEEIKPYLEGNIVIVNRKMFKVY